MDDYDEPACDVCEGFMEVENADLTLGSCPKCGGSGVKDPILSQLILESEAKQMTTTQPTITNSNELLELAAKALCASFAVIGGRSMRSLGRDPDTGEVEFVDWNPLTDYGDAFHLAVTLKLEIHHHDDEGVWRVNVGPPGLIGPFEILEHGDDPNGTTCRAIVRAAAEIGKAATESA